MRNSPLASRDTFRNLRQSERIEKIKLRRGKKLRRKEQNVRTLAIDVNLIDTMNTEIQQGLPQQGFPDCQWTLAISSENRTAKDSTFAKLVNGKSIHEDLSCSYSCVNRPPSSVGILLEKASIFFFGRCDSSELTSSLYLPILCPRLTSCLRVRVLHLLQQSMHHRSQHYWRRRNSSSSSILA